jgi:2-polyprenyl-3-methyl-5-hydroxy-6-metoxy-1,4-benzoquinol methylase
MSNKENLDNYDKAYDSGFKYNDENTWFLTRYAEYMSQSIDKNKFKNILSLGIGHHIVSEILAAELDKGISKYVILEGSKSIIDKFAIKKSHKDKIEVIHTYFEDYETDEKFDVIEMGFVLEHVDEPDFIVKKFKSFLSENGRMFISVPNARSLHRLIGFEAGLLENVYKLSDYDHQLGHKRYFDLESISNMVIDSGLKIDNKFGLFLKPISTTQMQQLGWSENIIKALLKIGETNPDISNCILIEAKI